MGQLTFCVAKLLANMVWTESEAGVWLDDLDGAERVFYDMSQAFARFGKEHGSVNAVCKIDVQASALKIPLETLIREAWKALRFDFPALSVVAEGSRKKYLAATPERLEHWVEETFSVNTVSSARDIVPTLHLKKLPRLIFLPPSREIIFHCSHWRIDALGTCMVLNRLCDLVSQGTIASPPQWNLEYQNLSPSLEDAFGSPKTCSPAMETMAETLRHRNFETSYPSAGLPFNGSMTTEPTLSQPQAIEFTTEATQDLVAACKAHSISVTAAIHAACAEAVFDRSKHINNHDYSTVVSANVREYLPTPPPQQQHSTKAAAAYACGTYVTGITHTVRRADSFATRSSQLTTAYRGSWSPPEYMTALRPIYRVHGDALLAAARSSRTRRPPASNVTVSSLGVVEKYLKRNHHGPSSSSSVVVVVERFHLGSAIMTRQPTLYIWTFGGQLTMSVDYNEAYYSSDAMAALLSSIESCLERKLEIDLGDDERVSLVGTE